MTVFTTNNYEDEIFLTLKSVMDLTMAENLRLSLLDCLTQNKTVKILTAEVERITTPCLQVLLAMKKQTKERHIDFFFPEMSEIFRDTVRDIGLEDQFMALEQRL